MADLTADLTPYVPRLLLTWEEQHGAAKHKQIDGTLVFADVSGFTKLSEALARKSGKAGAEEMADVINYLFGELLMLAAVRGGEMLKYGGDAMLLFFSGRDHAVRAAAACADMQRRLREIGRIDTGGAGIVRLRMSVGAHSGSFDFFVAGRHHRELLVAGPDTTVTVQMESTAEATEVLMSPAMAAQLPGRHAGRPKDGGILLRGAPAAALVETVPVDVKLDAGRFLAAPVARHLTSTVTEPEHRIATVAFLQFLELDRLLGADPQPEAAAARIDDVLTLIQESFLEFDVAFLATDLAADGGKVMAASGAPVSQGDDEERMLRACRRILDASPALPVRIGLNRGHVFAGDVGPPFRRTYTTLGDVTNTAARVMGQASGGQLLALRSVTENCRSVVVTEALTPFLAKGKRDPLVPLRVDEIGERRQRVTTRLPLHGMRGELSRLTRSAVEAQRGKGRCIRVVGGAGTGKTRLLDELESREEVELRRRACRRFDRSTPWVVVRDLLLAAKPEASAESVSSLLVRHSPALAGWAGPLAYALGIAGTPVESPNVDVRNARGALVEAATIVLRAALDESEASVFVIDDAQWMDSDSKAVLESLAPRLADVHAAIVLAGREVTVAEQADTIELGPLGNVDAAQLVRAAAPRPLLPQQVAAIVERAEGNPMALVAYARAARDDDTLPADVETLIAAEIDELPAERRSALRRLAVLGPRFARDLAVTVFGEETLEECDEHVDVDGETVTFSSTLLQETAYETLPYRERRSVHAKVADLLMGSGEDAGTVSYHYFKAHRMEDAWRTARSAAAEARDRLSYLTAAELYRRALDAASAIDVAASELARAWMELGDVMRFTGRAVEADRAYRQARQHARDDDLVRARLALVQGLSREAQGQLSAAKRWYRRGLDLAGSAPAGDTTRTRLLHANAAVRFHLGALRAAAEWSLRALREAERSDDTEGVGQAYQMLHLLALSGHPTDHPDAGERALAAFRSIGRLDWQSDVLNNLGIEAYYRGDWTTAVARYRAAQEADERAGRLVSAAARAANASEILSDQGHLGEAESIFVDVLETFSAARLEVHRLITIGNLGRVATRRGDFDRAERLLTEAADGLAKIGAAAFAEEMEVRQIERLAAAGQSREALESCRRWSAASKSPSTVSAVQRLEGIARFQEGDGAGGAAGLREAADSATRSESPFDEALALDALCQFGAASPEEHRRREDLLASLGIIQTLRFEDARGS